MNNLYLIGEGFTERGFGSRNAVGGGDYVAVFDPITLGNVQIHE